MLTVGVSWQKKVLMYRRIDFLNYLRMQQKLLDNSAELLKIISLI